MDIAKVNNIEIAYDCFGRQTDCVILLIAGLGTQMIRWTEPFCMRLAGLGYRVIRFDNRDVGRSTHFQDCASPDFATLAASLMAGRRPDVPYTINDMATDAVGLLDALSIRQAHVVGRSMGGMIAQIMASEFRERILSLTSIMSSTGNPVLPQASQDVMAMMMRPAPDPASDEEAFIKHGLAFAKRITGKDYPINEDAQRELIREELRRSHDPAGIARQIAAIAVAGDRRARLATIDVPSLVIHGSDDPLVPPACGEDTAACIPGSRLMMIRGMGHDLPAELYDEVTEAIDRTARQAAVAQGQNHLRSF